MVEKLRKAAVGMALTQKQNRHLDGQKGTCR